MEEPELIITRPAEHPGVVVATINRPPVNAVTTEFFQTMLDFFQAIGKDPKARCVILTAQGRLFCAGADVKKLNDRTTEGASSTYLEVIGNVGIFLSGILLLRLVIAIARDGVGVPER